MADEFTKSALYGIKTFNKKVKEKIGMQKLIELLNEYQYGMFVYENDLLLLRIGSNIKVGGETFVISKKLGFIKWLVENDKIDTESYCRITSIERKGEKDVFRDEVDSLLMLLSISDTPIEDLISYLK